ncbi:hypothetical protein CR513_37660, partial [Mucuna pruriens]
MPHHWSQSSILVNTKDYDIFQSNIHILCDNTAVINLSKNPILYFRAKHIEIKLHFIRDYVQKGTLDS